MYTFPNVSVQYIYIYLFIYIYAYIYICIHTDIYYYFIHLAHLLRSPCAGPLRGDRRRAGQPGARREASPIPVIEQKKEGTSWLKHEVVSPCHVLKVCNCHHFHGSSSFSWVLDVPRDGQGHDPREGWLQMAREGAARAPRGQAPGDVSCAFLNSIRYVYRYIYIYIYIERV